MRVDRLGETALHKACKGCHHPTIKEILGFISKSLGDAVDFVQKQNGMGETALHMACRYFKLHVGGNAEHHAYTYIVELQREISTSSKRMSTLLGL